MIFFIKWLTNFPLSSAVNKYFINTHSPIKLKLRIPYVSSENCSKLLDLYGVRLGPKQLCAGGEKSKDTCAGDSGGPLMYFDRQHSRWVAYGIVSYGFTQCGSGPGVYTSVLSYIGWIESVIKTSPTSWEFENSTWRQIFVCTEGVGALTRKGAVVFPNICTYFANYLTATSCLSAYACLRVCVSVNKSLKNMFLFK